MQTFLIEEKTRETAEQHIEAEGGKTEPNGGRDECDGKDRRKEKIGGDPHGAVLERAVNAGENLVERAACDPE